MHDALADTGLRWAPPAAGAFVLDGWLRLGFGAEIDTVRTGLARLGGLLATVPVG